MKKLIALVIAVLVICAVPAMAFAANSPSGEKVINVSVQKADIDGSDKTQVTVKEGGSVSVKTDASVGTFNNWKIYKVTGTGTAAKYVEAVAGTDYTVVTGTLKDAALTVKPLTDIVICANYNNKLTDPKTGDMSEEAPKTGASVALLAFVCTLSLAGAGVAAKKIAA